MAPLCAAIRVDFAHRLPGNVSVYKGQVDRDWTVTAVPNGGYVLGLMIEASMQYQCSTRHPDPIHLTSHFIRSAVVTAFEVHISVLKPGRGFTYLKVEFMQNGQCKVISHMIFGILEPPAETTEPKLTIAPPSPYARRVPMYTHPSKCPLSRPRRKWTYKNHIRLANDPVHANNAKKPQQGLEFGMYMSLIGQQDKITTPSLAFMADTFEALDEVIPGIHQDLRATSWAPTLVMTLEFKFPIPKLASTEHSSRTVAIFSSGKFMNDPQGRHDTYVEVWTAPSDIGEGNEKADWRESQRCLAVSTQMALLVSMDVNKKLGNRGVASTKL